MDDRISVATLLARAIDALFGNIVPLIVLATLLGGVWTFASEYMRFAGVPAPLPTGTTFDVAAFAIQIMIFALFQAIAVPVVIRRIAGQERRWGADIGNGLLLFVPVAILWVMASLVCLIGLIFLIVPGIMAYVIYSVATPAYLEERPGLIGAMVRSQDLTHGVRWPLFAVLTIYLAVATGIAFLAEYAGQEMGGEGGPTALTMASLTAASSVIGDVIYAPLLAAIYVALREREGASGDLIADVFA